MSERSITFVITTIFLVGTTVRAEAPPSNIECAQDSNILWPDYSRRENFHVCTSERKPMMMSCRFPQKFNFYQQQCVFANDWLEPPTPADVFPLMRFSESFKVNCEDDKAHWPVTENPSYYFQCVGRSYVVKRQCAFGEVFDAERQECAPFSPACHPHEMHLLWADPASLVHFFRCIAVGRSVREQCSEGLHFVFRIQMCIQTTQTTPIVQRAPNCTEDQLHLRWPDPAQDRNYFTCTNLGEYQLNSCLNGFIFDFSVQMCIVDPQATMTPAITPETTTQLGQTTLATTRNPYDPLECHKEDLHLRWPVPGFIYDFYVCIALEQPPVRVNCPQGTIFVFEIQSCANDPRIQTTYSYYSTQAVTSMNSFSHSPGN